MKSFSSGPTSCVVLLSGGIESAACVDFYQRQELEVRGFHISYGQAAAQEEQCAARAIAEHFSIPLHVVTVLEASPKVHRDIVGRSGFLLFTALMEHHDSHAVFALGIHAETQTYDCSSRFLDALQAIIKGCSSGDSRVAAPFLEWTKQDVWDYCGHYGVPVELTYSCEKGSRPPCGECYSCRKLEALRAIAKFDAPA